MKRYQILKVIMEMYTLLFFCMLLSLARVAILHHFSPFLLQQLNLLVNL